MQTFFEFILCIVAMTIGLTLIEKQVDSAWVEMLCDFVGLIIIVRASGFMWERAHN